MVAEAAAE
ncbi:unnamed protein product, partial [Rotaria sp. Silwood1]